jgi:hypothetical protein
LAAEKGEGVSVLKRKIAAYVALGMILLFGALYLVFFCTKPQKRHRKLTYFAARASGYNWCIPSFISVRSRLPLAAGTALEEHRQQE